MPYPWSRAPTQSKVQSTAPWLSPGLPVTGKAPAQGEGMPETTSSFLDKLQPAPQKKLLALDGGGIRGVLTLEILAGVEEIVRRKLARPDAVLADYFDYIAGTSTGAIIGTCLAIGMLQRSPRFLPQQRAGHVQPGGGAPPIPLQIRAGPPGRHVKRRPGR